MRKLFLLLMVLFGLLGPQRSATAEQIPARRALFLPVVGVPDRKEYMVIAPLGRYITLDAGDYIQVFCNRGELVSMENSGIVYCEEEK